MTIVNSTLLSPKELRKLLRSRRRSLTALQQKLATKNLYKQVVNTPIFRRSKSIGFYLANDGEINPHLLMKIAKHYKKQIFLPVLKKWPKFAMTLQQISTNTRWTLNQYNIKQPVYNKRQEAHPLKLDLILMPLVGFDNQGGRLGMGAGFYDRYFAYQQRLKQWHKPYLIGLAHECQKVDKLCLNKWDIKVSAVVTDRNWYIH